MKRKLPLILIFFICISHAQEKLNIYDAYLQELLTHSPNNSIANFDTTDENWRKSTISTITSEHFLEPSFLKTSMVLHMLRYKLEDAVYEKLINGYLADITAKNESIALSNFIAYLSGYQEEDLTDFVNDWFVGKGYPSYTLSWFQNQENGDLSITIEQNQSDRSVSFFEMPLPIEVRNDDGDSQLIRLEISENKQGFTGAIPFTITQVEIDPSHHLITKNNTVKKGVDQQALNAAISLYPNPARNSFKIKNSSNAIVEKVSIYNMLGKLIMEEDHPLLAINLRPLNFGIHLVKIETDQGTLHKTILKEK